MSTYRFTDEQVVTTLREVVNERPEYVYKAPEHMVSESGNEDCFYVHHDEDGSNPRPGCLVGEVLHRLGVPLVSLQRMENKGAFMVCRDNDLTSSRAAGALGAVQTRQDEGDSWALALEIAEEKWES